MAKYETWCPMFPGFYNTVFEYDREDDDILEYNRENKTNLSYDDFEWDYKDYYKRITKCFCNRLEKELSHYLKIKISFQDVHSPKEYNFANDSINICATVSLPAIFKIINQHYENSRAYFIAHYTSCSGFISFHSNNVDDWLKKDYILENPAHRIGGLLACICEILLDDDYLYYWCDDEMYMNFTIKTE